MTRLKEYNNWTVEEKFYMPDMNGHRGIDLLGGEGIVFVHGSETADVGIWKNGEAPRGCPASRSILMAFEPPSQIPMLYDPHYQSQFLGVMSAIRIPPTAEHFYIPRAFNNVPEFFGREKRRLLCFIGRDMGAMGHHENDLTSTRRETIKFLSGRMGPEKFDCYGRGWTGSCYHGEVGPTAHGLAGYMLSCPVTENQEMCWDGKYKLLSEHKFTLAMENSIWPGYYGCKALEAMQCGSIPIYVGDPEIDQHTSKDVYIDMRNRDMDDIADQIEQMSEEEIAGYRARIYKYLEKEANEMFSSVTLAKKFIKMLGRLNDRR
jgi:hypothetical protein